MAVANVYVFAFLTALVAANLIFAEQNSLEQESQLFGQEDVGSDSERKVRSVEDEKGQKIIFPGLFPIKTRCNYTATGGWSCASCRRTLQCLPSNVGIVRSCLDGLIRYCKNGQCSAFPGSKCSSRFR